MTNGAQGKSGKFTLILLASLVVSLFCAVYPIYVIRPFRHQGARELAIALMVTRFRPVITAAMVLIAMAAAAGYWRAQASKLRRALTVVGAVLSIALAVVVHVNVYELMFHPLVRPSFTAVNKVKLDGAEKVVAVRIGREARAYPIRGMSYHHVVNDVLGSTALVATY